MSLKEYRRKRDFEKTVEPKPDGGPNGNGHRFVIQKHAASRLHYDFRLVLDGTLKSWAVPSRPLTIKFIEPMKRGWRRPRHQAIGVTKSSWMGFAPSL